MKNATFTTIGFVFIFLLSFVSSAQVGINTTSPKSTLDINGNLSVKTVSVSGNGTGGGGSAVLLSDGVYISVSPSSNDDKFELPDPTQFPGRVYFIRNIHNTNTAQLITPSGLFFLKGITSGGSSNIFMYNNHLRSVLIVSDGLNWTIFNAEDGASLP